MKVKSVTSWTKIMQRIQLSKKKKRAYKLCKHSGKLLLEAEGYLPMLLDTENRHHILMLVDRLEYILYENITTEALKVMTDAVNAELENF